MPLMTWRLGDWLGLHKVGIRHRRRPLSRPMGAESLESRALLAGSAIVSGLTFIDANGNGDSDNGEIVVRGIVVTLTGTGVNAQTTTDANGTFTFIRVPAGTYTLTAQPGDQLVGPAVSAAVVVGVADGEVNENLAVGGLKPTLVSLRQFLNTSTTETLPFAAAGDGREAASNDAPTVLANELARTITVTSSASPTATNIDLAGIFTDANFENSEVRFRTSAGNINVELYDEDTPITVANFYEYANSGRYNDTIFHRLVNNFVLQGGGFKFDDTTNTFPAVTTDPTIKNEPDTVNRSNLANTIAMAKLGGDANSASSQFFFNLADNRGTSPNGLDFQNGKFTVFGKIAGSTPTPTTPVTNTELLNLADTPVSNRSSTNSAFGELPLNNYTGTTFPTDAAPSNFLRILGIDTVRRDESLTYTLMSGSSTVATIDTSLLTATIVNHRLKVTPKAGQSGQADIIVKATDQFGDSVTTAFHVHIPPAGNVAPTATVILNPEEPLVDSTLTATATTADGNNNPVNLTYVWKVNGTIVKTTPATTSLSDTLDLSTIATEAAGNAVTVEVTPNDGFVDGAKVTASRTIVGSNSAPTATVNLTPASPTVSSVLTATATKSDVNGNPVTLTYVWKVGTTTVKTTSATSSLTDTLNLAGVTVSADDTVSVEVTPNDGTVDGTPVTDSEEVNEAPTATASLSPVQPLVNSIITATATTSDADNDSVLLTYIWKVGTTTVKTTSATSSLADTLDLSTITEDVKGAVVSVEITPNDGAVDGAAATDSKVLANSAPTATVNLTPASPTVSSVLTATATKSDLNGDPVTLTYVWKVGTTTVKTTPATSSLTDTLDLSGVTVSAGDTVSVEVIPFDGTAEGATATDSEVVVNEAPTATASLSPEQPLVDSIVTATATVSDADNDSVLLTYVWKVGTTTVKTTSATSSLADTLDLSTITEDAIGEVVTVEITPNDGTIDGITVTDSKTISS